MTAEDYPIPDSRQLVNFEAQATLHFRKSAAVKPVIPAPMMATGFIPFT